MAIIFSYTLDEAILKVKASGKDENLSEVIEYGMSIVKTALSTGKRKILCDETELEYSLNTFDTYASAKFISENAPKIARIAIVCRAEDNDDGTLWETVALNNGLTVKVFNRIDKAEKWLLS